MAEEAPDRLAAQLRDDVRRGQALDRDLAHDLGRAEPERTSPGPAAFERLAAGAGLEGERERRLVRAAQAGDPAARAELVEACLPRIAAVARTYRSGQVQRVELLQEGVVGLLRALERFDPERGVPFWGYATWWVRQAMQQLVAELTGPVVLSDRALRHLARLKDANRAAYAATGAEPGPAALAERAGLSEEQVVDLLAAERTPRSLHEPTGGDDEVGTFGELLADPLAEAAYEDVLARLEVQEVHALLGALSEREREVLRARFGLDGPEQARTEVAGRLGVSAERVRQVEARALGKLAAAFHPPG